MSAFPYLIVRLGLVTVARAPTRYMHARLSIRTNRVLDTAPFGWLSQPCHDISTTPRCRAGDRTGPATRAASGHRTAGGGFRARSCGPHPGLDLHPDHRARGA